MRGTRIVVCAVTMVMLSIAGINSARAQTVANFKNVFPIDSADYPAKEKIKNCGGEYKTQSARLVMYEYGGQTLIYISVKRSVPNAFLTIWLKHAGTSPLTGAGATPLANPDDIVALSDITPAANLTATAMALGLMGDDGSGGTVAANGFWTDSRGNGTFIALLDYPVTRGAFQYSEFSNTLNPLASDNMPFTLRIISHCFDGVAHGLIPGKHEQLFDWSWK